MLNADKGKRTNDKFFIKSLFKQYYPSPDLGVFGCGTNNITASSEDKATVVASYSVLCDLTETIAQDTVDLTCLVDPDQNAHTYNPTPSERKTIELAELILYGGYEFEPSIVELVEAGNTSAKKIAVHEKAVSNPIMAEHHHHDEESEEDPHSEEAHAHKDEEAHAHKDEEAHEEAHAHKDEEAHTNKDEEEELEPDPHVWHDVENAIAMVEVIVSELAEINPDNAELYQKNGEQLQGELERLDAWIKEQIATIPQGKRILIATHDGLNYYVRAYGLEEFEALQGLSPEESPTASRVKELVRKINSAKVPTIFAEVTANNKVIETVAREAKVKISPTKLLVDGLGEKGSKTGTYIGAIASNTCAIVDGLGGKCNPFEQAK